MVSIPWVFSNAGKNSYFFPDTASENQHVGRVTVPVNCAATQLMVCAAGYGGSVSARVCIWYVGGTVIAQSTTFTMAQADAGDEIEYEKDITPVLLDAGSYWVGVYHNPNTRHTMGTNTNDTGYIKINNSTFPSVSSMSGYSSYSNDEPFVGIFYITAPTAPSGASTVRNSDTSITFSWTNNTATDQPYTTLYLQRYDNVTGNWYAKATLSSSTANYTDTSVISNRTYQYRVTAYNLAGYSSYLTGSEINTTPASVTSLVATRSGTNVNLTWVDEATNEDQFRIQKRSSADSGVTWGAWGSDLTVAANSESWTDVTPATYGQYRVRAEETGQSLYSAYTESNVVLTIAPPNVPTALVPDNTVFDAANSKLFTWTHNATDGTGQSKFSIRFTTTSGVYTGHAADLTEEVSGTSEHTFAGGTFANGTVYYYQVKTWGQHATSSDWSVESTFETVSTPVAVITDPTALVNYTVSTFTATWSYTQAESNNQTEYMCVLYDSNDIIIESKSVSEVVASGANGSATFNTILSNETTYKVTLLVKEEKCLWSVLTDVTFVTAFTPPPSPVFTVTMNETTGYALIAITNPSAGVGETETEYNKVYKSVDGGVNYSLLQDNIPINTTIIDYTPLLNGNTYYFVMAVSAIPSSKRAGFQNLGTILYGTFFLNSGADYSDYIKLTGDVTLSDKLNRLSTTKMFEGRVYPVKYQSANAIQSVNFSCDLPFTDYNTLVAILDYVGNLMYRDWYGRRFTCNVTNPQFSFKDAKSYQFSCTIDRVSVID